MLGKLVKISVVVWVALVLAILLSALMSAAGAVLALLAGAAVAIVILHTVLVQERTAQVALTPEGDAPGSDDTERLTDYRQGYQAALISEAAAFSINLWEIELPHPAGKRNSRLRSARPAEFEYPEYVREMNMERDF